MAMLAAPHPSFSCLTKGTSSHIPGAVAAASTAVKHAIANLNLAMERLIKLLPHRDNDQNQCHHGQNNEDQVTSIQSAGGKLALGLLRTRCHLRQLGITQGCYRSLDLLRADVRGLQRLCGLCR